MGKSHTIKLCFNETLDVSNGWDLILRKIYYRSYFSSFVAGFIEPKYKDITPSLSG